MKKRRLIYDHVSQNQQPDSPRESPTPCLDEKRLKLCGRHQIEKVHNNLALAQMRSKTEINTEC